LISAGLSLRAMKLIGVVLAVFASAIAQSDRGHTILGKVRAQSGQTIGNVLVQLETGNGVLISQTVTTNEGDYAFSGLEGASFSLVVEEPGHERFTERIELTREGTTRPGETVRVDIILVPKPRPATPKPGTVFQQEIPANALEAYRRGVKLLGERKTDMGLAALRTALQIFPKYFDAHLAIALELFKGRKYPETIAHLEAARAINPRDNRLYQTFGLVLFEQKNYSVAIQVFDAAIKLNASDAQSYLMRGASLIETGRLDAAADSLNRANEISGGKLGLVHLHLARIYERKGERKRAADELEKYLRQNQSAPNAGSIREAITRLRNGESGKKNLR